MQPQKLSNTRMFGTMDLSMGTLSLKNFLSLLQSQGGLSEIPLLPCHKFSRAVHTGLLNGLSYAPLLPMPRITMSRAVDTDKKGLVSLVQRHATFSILLAAVAVELAFAGPHPACAGVGGDTAAAALEQRDAAVPALVGVVALVGAPAAAFAPASVLARAAPPAAAAAGGVAAAAAAAEGAESSPTMSHNYSAWPSKTHSATVSGLRGHQWTVFAPAMHHYVVRLSVTP